ncbi:hypothetical protein [Microbacterium sp. 3J1]|uniref:hypothetical protein n=1 Tax=Microbacterium sp. 3J1 TaxID=861269 RepID=UPI000AD7A3AF|nr:hypothetical protein [Microbacterium sp. 3J1]
MISTLSIWNDLAPLFGFLGAAGVVVAVSAAVAAGVAGALDHADALVGGTGMWVAGVLLSACASYVDGWWLIGTAVAAWPAALLLGVLARFVVRSAGAWQVTGS